MAHHVANNGPVQFKGRYYAPLPVDFVILDLLPEKGMIGGIHWRGRRVADVRDEVNDQLEGELTVESTLIQSRMRAMHVAGLVQSFPAAARGDKIWARLPLGNELIEHKEAYLGI